MNCGCQKQAYLLPMSSNLKKTFSYHKHNNKTNYITLIAFFFLQIIKCTLHIISINVSFLQESILAGWRDTDSQKPRLDGQVGELDDLFNQVCNSRPQHAAEIKAIEPGQETPLNLRKAQKKKSIKNLFTPAPKFHRNLKR